MTAAGDAVLAVAYSQVGVTEDPPGSNNVPYDDEWGFWSAWCATFVSWCCTTAGYPLPPIDGPAGFSYCPSGQIAAYTTGHETGESGAEPGDTLIFSWEPWHMEGGIAICSSGVYAGAAAGDHTGHLVAHLGGGALQTIEGNTSSLSWDNGGEVRERWDRYSGQICAYARHAALEGGPSTTPPKGWLDMLTDQQQSDLYRMVESIFWMVGNQNPAAGAETIAGKVDEVRRYAQSTYWMVGNQDPAAGSETVASDARAARDNTDRLLEGG